MIHHACFIISGDLSVESLNINTFACGLAFGGAIDEARWLARDGIDTFGALRGACQYFEVAFVAS